MKCFIFFTYPDSSAVESSLSTRREGEEGEFFIIKFTKTKKILRKKDFFISLSILLH